MTRPHDWHRRWRDKYSGLGGGGSILPLTIDFSTLDDGALPAPFVGSTWSIVSGKAVNNPTLGTELLTDPGLEAAYAAGKCGTLTLNGVPTLADDTVTMHGGAHAQQFTAAAFNNRLNFPTIAGVIGRWVQFSGWAKQTVGTTGTVQMRLDQSLMLPAASAPANIYGTGGAYTLFKSAGVNTETANMFPYALIESNAAGDTVIGDDYSLKAITESSLYALLPATQANVIGKVMPDAFADATPIGIIIGADAQTSPANLMMAVFARHTNAPTIGDVYLIKKVAGFWTPVLTLQTVTIAANAWFEVRRSGSTVKVYYNNVQVSTDQTVSDAAIVAGAFHGSHSAGGNALKQVFFQAN